MLALEWCLWDYSTTVGMKLFINPV